MTPNMKNALEALKVAPIIVTMSTEGKVIHMSVEGVSLRTLKALVDRDLVNRRLLSLSKDIYEIA